MKIKFKHNGVWGLVEYQVEEGAVITRNFNETLDSATIRINNIASSDRLVNLEPYDECLIDDTYYFCIDTYTETMVGVNPIIYCYDISLFSQTKILEGYICPNLSITPRKIHAKRTIYDYLTYYNDKYGPKVRRLGYESKETADINATRVGTNTYSFTGTIDANAINIKVCFADSFQEVSNLIYSVSGTTITGTFEADEEAIGDAVVFDTFVTGVTTDDWTPFSSQNQIYAGRDMLEADFYITSTHAVANVRNVAWNSASGTIIGEIYGSPVPNFYGNVVLSTGAYRSYSVYVVYDLTNTEKYTFENKYSFANRVASKFNVECPELQWNMPTLREVFNDLMMINDCIVILNNNVIDYLDISTTTGSIDNASGINYIQKSQSSSDYVSEVQMQMVNVIGNNTTTTYENIPFDCENYVATDENIILKTKYPILNIKHLWINFFVGGPGALFSNDKKYYRRVDLCDFIDSNHNHYNFVKEFNEYQTLPLKYRTSSLIDTPVPSEMVKYQNFNLYYNRYSNAIQGFTNQTKNYISSNTALSWIKYLCYHENYVNLGANVYYSTFFQIEYETNADCMFKASKKVLPINERTIIDNQTNAFVDGNTQGYLEYQKANRLGNPQLMINQRVNNISDAIQYGKTYGDNYVVYNTQYQIYKNHIEVNAQLSQNYVLKNYFTGIKSKIRTWVNAKDEAVKKNNLVKYYCELSYSEKKEVPIKTFSPVYFASCINNNTISPLKYVNLKTRGYNAKYLPNYNYYYGDIVKRIVGDSMVFNFGFDDNWYYGKHAVITTASGSRDVLARDIKTTNVLAGDKASPHISNNVFKAEGGITLAPYKYVDDDGEYNQIAIYFKDTYKDYNMEDRDFVLPDVYKEYMTDSYLLPEIKPVGDVPFRFNVNELKDNKEIPNYSIQFEFCTDDDKITFKKEFIEYQKALYNGSALGNAVIWVNGATRTGNINITNKNSMCAKIELTFNTSVNVNDTINIIRNNKELLSFKVKIAGTTQIIYLNLLQSRNSNVYDSNNNKIGII